MSNEHVSPLGAQCRIADKALICIRHADELMRGSTDEPTRIEFAAGHDMAKRHARRLTAAAAEIARLLKEGW